MPPILWPAAAAETELKGAVRRRSDRSERAEGVQVWSPVATRGRGTGN